MSKRTFEKYILNENACIKDALECINSLTGTLRTLFVADAEGVIRGSLTDGDIRRGLIAGVTLDAPVCKVMHRHFMYLTAQEEAPETIRSARHMGINLLPVLDKEGHMTDLMDLQQTHCILPMDAVLMAGGRGERLRPLTDSVPKPLLPVAGKPIIDYNVEALHRCGIKNIFATVNYLHEQIEEHFSKRNDDTPVRCILEPKALGTLGSIGLIKSFRHANVLVMNSDLLTTIDIEKMYEHHQASQAALTMAVTTYGVSVPYAIVRTQDDRVTSFEEKPTYNYFANAGIYIIRTDYLASVSGHERVDATDFIDSLLAQGLKVSYFPIEGTWIDIGSPDDYRMANRKSGLN